MPGSEEENVSWTWYEPSAAHLDLKAPLGLGGLGQVLMVPYLQEQDHIAARGLGGEMRGNIACHTTSKTSAAELISCAGRKGFSMEHCDADGVHDLSRQIHLPNIKHIAHLPFVTESQTLECCSTL